MAEPVGIERGASHSAVVMVEARGLRVEHGGASVLAGIDLDVPAGSIFGVVGRASSGKTALLEALVGLRASAAGSVRWLGLDGEAAGAELRRRVGIALRPAAVERRLTVRRALALFARFYSRRADLDALLDELALGAARERRVERLSPQELARFSLALALVHRPDVLVADEPTRELDPEQRRCVWGVLQRRRNEGSTIVMTTNLLDEAERLCDRVAILSGGRIVACDAPAAIVGGSGASGRIVLETREPLADDVIAGLPAVRSVTRHGPRVELATDRPLATLGVLAAALERARCAPHRLSLERATLGDRFRELTGEGAWGRAGGEEGEEER